MIPLRFWIPSQGTGPDLIASPPFLIPTLFLMAFWMFNTHSASLQFVSSENRSTFLMSSWGEVSSMSSSSTIFISSSYRFISLLNKMLVSSVTNYKSWFLKPVFYISNKYTTGIVILLLTFLHSVTNSNNSIRL